jgi:hypothetical protein
MRAVLEANLTCITPQMFREHMTQDGSRANESITMQRRAQAIRPRLLVARQARVAGWIFATIERCLPEVNLARTRAKQRRGRGRPFDRRRRSEDRKG